MSREQHRAMTKRIIGRLDEARDSQGMTQEELAKRLGVTRFSLMRLVNGERRALLEDLIAFAEALGLNWSEVVAEPAHGTILPLTNPSSGWQRTTWRDKKFQDELIQMYRSAQVVLSCCKRPESWMMPEKMFECVQRNRLVELPLDEDTTDAIDKNYAKWRENCLRARQHAGNYSRVIVSDATFRQVMLEPAGRDWLSGMGKTVLAFQQFVSVTVALKNRWRFVTKTLAERLALDHEWSKIVVIDDHFAAYWPCPESWFFTRQPTEVKKFKLAIEECLGEPDSPAATASLLDKIGSRRR
ncbi:MAG: helix-turn-helix transcriptional regulator [Gemmataceae bacterium]|nr:helix-turn-helix transcriptional regulator [Gemmataceae bacterium]